jgi:hypothetical protein
MPNPNDGISHQPEILMPFYWTKTASYAILLDKAGVGTPLIQFYWTEPEAADVACAGAGKSLMFFWRTETASYAILADITGVRAPLKLFWQTPLPCRLERRLGRIERRLTATVLRHLRHPDSDRPEMQ